MDKKTVLLTGSSGFIGSYFMNHTSNCQITPLSFRNAQPQTLKLHNYDAIVHLAALVHQMNGADKSEYERINVTQTLELALKAKKDGVKQFVFMSTVKVYGEETNDVYTEVSACHPEDEYGKSKLKAEKALLELESKDFVVSIIRTPIVYGLGVKANIKNLLNLVQKVPLLPFAGIENRRSMVHVGNLCHLLDTVIRQRASGIFLASDDKPISTTKLIELIAKNLNKTVYLIKVPLFESLLKLLKPSFHKRLYGNLEVDNTLTKQKLNLINPISTEDGMRMI